MATGGLTGLPSEERISDGATIEHRVLLDDGGPRLAATKLTPIVFRSFWDRIISDHQVMLWTGAGTLALLTLYLVPVLLLF